MMLTPQPREQEFAPLLFSLTPDVTMATPRSATQHRTAELSMSAQRRSAMTGGSVHTEGTPQAPPPPVARLMDDVAMEDNTPPHLQAQQQAPGGTPASFAALPTPVMPAAAPFVYNDVWVTIYGFSPADVPLILDEFGMCGDILQWGTFGVPKANFIHVQYQNRHAAQRALLRDGELLAPGLIVGVRPLDPRHRAAIAEYNGEEAGLQVMRQQLAAERPYRLEKSAVAQEVPRPSRATFASKIAQFVLGI